jgi:SAM-dependent methyltransferase
VPRSLDETARRAVGRLKKTAVRWRSTPGGVRMGALRRVTPISSTYGFDRGTPIDRYYMDRFLHRYRSYPGYSGGLIQGRVLEIGGRDYADRFGVIGDAPATGVIDQLDVLHADASNTEATIVGDLTNESSLPEDTFDCILCLQTLHVIYDVRAALRTLYRGLKPGGTLLATGPGITSSCLPDRDHWGDWWRFTAGSARRLLEEVFPAEHVEVESYGNVLTAASFLYGLSAQDLEREELDVADRNFEVLIAMRATKPA